MMRKTRMKIYFRNCWKRKGRSNRLRMLRELNFSNKLSWKKRRSR